MEKTFRWGILGTANIAGTFVDAVRRVPGAEVRAVASRSLSRAEEWARAQEVPRAFGSYLKLIESGEIDAVYLPLPNSLHDEWCLRAIENGLPVLCEKPFALNAAQAEAVAEASVRSGVPVAEAFMYRFHPIYEKVLSAIAAGRIGALKTIASRFTFLLDDRNSISASAELGGGALMDVGCYCVNLSRLIARAEPVRASAVAHMGEVDETMAGVLEFSGGITASFEASVESFERHGAEIAGSEGSIIIEKPWFPGEDGASFVLRTPAGDETVETPGGNGYVLEIEDFMRAVLDKHPPRWPVEDAVKNMAVIDALYRSVRTDHSRASVGAVRPGGV
ncbi:MAG: Gfo/Idh/MocA family oxidoreductase [Deltaproteobacteria bacterium]|nr:Gfo/Idh/MocA family oxidoreductase [Deltaproteobacteria bacterium]